MRTLSAQTTGPSLEQHRRQCKTTAKACVLRQRQSQAIALTPPPDA